MFNENNYKLIKFSGSKRAFKDTILGTDIGIHSDGFVKIIMASLLITISVLVFMYFSFRI